MKGSSTVVDVVSITIDGSSARVLITVLRVEILCDLGVSFTSSSGTLNETVDLVLGEVSLFSLNSDGLFGAGSGVLGRDVEDTVDINIKSNFNLGLSTVGSLNSLKVEFGEKGVILNKTTFSFEDRKADTSLVILGGSKSLGSSDRESGVSGDEVSHNTTGSLESNADRGHVNSGNFLKVLLVFSGENGRLNSGSVSNSLISVNVSVESLSLEGLSKNALNLGDFG